MKKGRAFIGTSGWNYKHWIGLFYPDQTKPQEQLPYYLEHFKTVELNSPFYHLPKLEVFKKWKKVTPARFVFSVKASRYITHVKRLKDVEESVKLFLSRARGLSKKLGPILFQLPPGFKINLERLNYFLKLLPSSHRYTFEFRNPSWYDSQVLKLLQDHNCAFCIYELAGHKSPAETTADFVYIRLHGPGNKYQGSYTPSVLLQWQSK